MLAISEDSKKKVAELKAKRKPLFEYYEKNPNETRLVLEIKDIDDRIAEYQRQARYEKVNRN